MYEHCWLIMKGMLRASLPLLLELDHFHYQSLWIRISNIKQRTMYNYIYFLDACRWLDVCLRCSESIHIHVSITETATVPKGEQQAMENERIQLNYWRFSVPQSFCLSLPRSYMSVSRPYSCTHTHTQAVLDALLTPWHNEIHDVPLPCRL